MPDPIQEDSYAHLLRLVREDREQMPTIRAASRKALDESRELLRQVARDHPKIP